MDQQGTSTPFGASGADPAPAKETEDKLKDRCCFGDPNHPYIGYASDPEVDLQQPGKPASAQADQNRASTRKSPE